MKTRTFFLNVQRWWWLVNWVLIAQIPGEEPADLPEIEENQVVTAQFRPESAKDSVIEVLVFDRAEIEARSAANLRELFVQEPLMEMVQHSVFGTSLRINGTSHEHVQILVDGMPAIGRLDGILDLEQFSLSGIDRVELIRGPASVYYGTDSLGGVVNLITGTPAREGPTVELSSDYRDVGDRHHRLGLALSRGAHVFSLDVNRRDFEGSGRDQGRRLTWAERRQDGLRFKWQTRFAGMSLRYLGSIFDETLMDLGTLTAGRGLDYEYRTQRTEHQVSLVGQLNALTYAEVNLGYATYERGRSAVPYFAETDDHGAPLPRDPDFDNQFDLIKVRGMLSWERLFAIEPLAAQIGMDVSLESGSGGRLAQGGAEAEDRALFAGLRWENRAGLSLQPMVRLIDNSLYPAPVTPALHLKYAPHDRLDWRATYARGFRGPSLKQLFLDFSVAAGPLRYQISGNPNLEAERGHHLTSSLRTRLLDRSDWRMSLEVSGFYSDVRDLITLSEAQPDPDQAGLLRRRYINIQQHRGHGATLGLQADYRETGLAVTLARSRTGNYFAADPDASGFSDRWDVSGRFVQHLKRRDMTFLLMFKHIGDQPAYLEVAGGGGQGDSIRRVEIKAYSLLDLTWSRHWPNRGWRLHGGAMNLLDVKRQDALDLGAQRAHAENHIDWGRNFRLGLAYQWPRR